MITATPLVMTGVVTRESPPTLTPTSPPVPTKVYAGPLPTSTRTPFTLPTPDRRRGSPTIFPGLDPEDVFYVVVQYNNGANYYFYEYDERAQSICDKSRPAGIRECNIDLVAFLEPFIAIPVEEYFSQMPDGINWTYDWENWKSGYTEVLVVMEVRAWDQDTDQSRRWWFGASSLSDEYAFAYIRNRYDHYNYAMIDAAKLNPLIGSRAPVKP